MTAVSKPAWPAAAAALAAAALSAAAGSERLSFVRHEIAPAPDVEVVRLADADGDGDLDVFAGERSRGNIDWWENVAGDGSRFAERAIAGDFEGVVAFSVADLERDGDVDLVAAATEWRQLKVWFNDGRGRYRRYDGLVFDVPGVRHVQVADVNDDGAADLLTVAADGVSWWLGNGQAVPAFERIPLAELSATVGAVARLDAADVDGDGHTDLVAANTAGDRIEVWRQVPGGLLPAFERVPAAGYHEPDVADVRLAGDLTVDSIAGDLLALRSAPSRVLGWGRGAAGGYFRVIAPLARAPAGVRWAAADAGDMDGDRVADFAVAEVGGQLAWYENQSPPATPGPTSPPPPPTDRPGLAQRAFLPAAMADE